MYRDISTIQQFNKKILTQINKYDLDYFWRYRLAKLSDSKQTEI